MKTALVVGGTSGLGLALAQQLGSSYNVIVTGSGGHHPAGLDVRTINLADGPNLVANIVDLVAGLPTLDLLVYAAGFAQIGTITDLGDEAIGSMALVGLIAPARLMKELLTKQGSLPQFIAITSTSAFVPRAKEPLYTGVKAGLGMLAHSLSLDARIGQTLVAAPGGMATAFWDGSGVDVSQFLDPSAVATIIVAQLDSHYQYRLIKIPRDTGVAEIVDEAGI